MFRNLRLKPTPDKLETLPSLSAERLAGDSHAPITLLQLNALPENIKRRLYRGLIPTGLLTRFGIDPITWKGLSGVEQVWLEAPAEKGVVHLWAGCSHAARDEFFRLELADNAFNGIDLQLLLLNDPDSEYFQTDSDPQGNSTHFGTTRRNLAEEQRAMLAGLAPGQIRSSLGASKTVFERLDTFLVALGHRAYFLEPLSYASAWVFERRGFAYVRGHKLMDEIHHEFRLGGRLHAALDGSSPFRQPGQANSVRGRAWAIQDGILEALEARWDNLRMVKQVGRHAGVQTFPGATY